MGFTITLNNSITFTKPFVNWASLAIGVSKEPALSAANLTLQTIVGPPFAWAWNRSNQKVQVYPGLQDYAPTIVDFSYLECASIQAAADITNTVLNSDVATYTALNSFVAGEYVTVTGCINGGTVFNVISQQIVAATATDFTLAIVHADIGSAAEAAGVAVSGQIFPLELADDALTEAAGGAELARPQQIATQYIDDHEIITFRTLPVANRRYQMSLTYQEAPELFTDTNETWGMPDWMQYIYNYFFLFLILDYFDDPKAQRYRQLAVASLLARAEGLDSMSKNIFLGNWLEIAREAQHENIKTAQAGQARGI